MKMCNDRGIAGETTIEHNATHEEVTVLAKKQRVDASSAKTVVLKRIPIRASNIPIETTTPGVSPVTIEQEINPPTSSTEKNDVVGKCNTNNVIKSFLLVYYV